MEPIEKIKALLKTFPQLGMSGQKTFRCVDEDVFLDGVKQIFDSYEPPVDWTSKNGEETHI